MSEEQADVLTPSLLDDLPNTYTYTKGLAEYILMKEAGDLPISIFRPSIVGAAVKEPAVVSVTEGVNSFIHYARAE